MIWEECAFYRDALAKARRSYALLMRQQAELFAGAESFEGYAAARAEARLDARLEEAARIEGALRYRCGEIEKQLAGSGEALDKVYRMRWIEGWKVRKIARRLCYSEAQIYRMIKVIQEKMRKNEREAVVELERGGVDGEEGAE